MNRVVELGRALWGERWQRPMAEALGVNKDTVQDWRQGRYSPRPDTWARLLEIAEARRAALASILERESETTPA